MSSWSLIAAAGLQGGVVVPAEEWVELANGCLCCSVKSDFVAALEGLMLKRDKFDYILIETTGKQHAPSWPPMLSGTGIRLSTAQGLFLL